MKFSRNQILAFPARTWTGNEQKNLMFDFTLSDIFERNECVMIVFKKLVFHFGASHEPREFTDASMCILHSSAAKNLEIHSHVALKRNWNAQKNGKETKLNNGVPVYFFSIKVPIIIIIIIVVIPKRMRNKEFKICQIWSRLDASLLLLLFPQFDLLFALGCL